MAISKSMDSPIKKSSYANQVEQSRSSQSAEEGSLMFLPVPGPQGDRGPKGDTGPVGEQGPSGPKGDKGDAGKNGRDGKNGLDGKSVLSPSEQMLGWGYYESENQKQFRTGIDQGKDGWVNLFLDDLSEELNEKYLPVGNVALWNKTTKRLNLRTLNTGSIVTICYNVLLTTYSTNTEVWFKTYVGEESMSPVSYVGNLKYQYDYQFTVEQKIFIQNNIIKDFGGIPQIRTDNSCEASISSIYISVS